MTITFIGHGYVGLVTACVFADFGNKVWVIGHTKEKIERLKKGDPLIYEPGLKELLEKNLKANRIFFTLDYHQAIPESDIVFISVGTPPKEDGEADLSTVFDVARKKGRGDFKKAQSKRSDCLCSFLSRVLKRRNCNLRHLKS